MEILIIVLILPLAIMFGMKLRNTEKILDNVIKLESRKKVKSQESYSDKEDFDKAA